MELRTKPLHESFGLEVLDVDLAQLDPSTFDAIYRLWRREPLLLFRRQNITEDEMVAYSRGFGELEVTVRGEMHSPKHPEVIYVSPLKRPDGSTLGGLGSSELVWHTDQIYRQRPATGSIFHGTEMPEGAGNTSFCNMAVAYAALPDDLRAQVEGKRAHCKYGQKWSPSFQDLLDEKQVEAIHDRTPPVTHEMVLDIPDTDARTLYISPNHTFAIEGMTDIDGRALLDALLAHALRDQFIYTHRWRNGDLIMWDNGRLLHRRAPFDGALPRFAKRTTIFLRPEHFAVPAACDGL